MNILVLDVAASISGAVTVLTEYYHKALADQSNTYYFCVSVIPLESKNNVTVLSFPWVKKSWLHRLFFDCYFIRDIIQENKIDKVLSLQNLIIPFCNLPQTVYLHQSIPFTNYRFSIWNDPRLWVYQNVIALMIFHSLRKANKVIVQTNWMKDAVIKRLSIFPESIVVEKPVFKLPAGKKFDCSNYSNRFFYPATGFTYKNHITLYRAAAMLKRAGINNFEITLTLTEAGLPSECRALHKELDGIIKLVGVLKHEQVIDEYCRSVLVFPSYIETFGLPLLEAKTCDSYIISSDEPFSREILNEYDRVTFFPARDYKQLAELMKQFIVA